MKPKDIQHKIDTEHISQRARLNRDIVKAAEQNNKKMLRYLLLQLSDEILYYPSQRIDIIDSLAELFILKPDCFHLLLKPAEITYTETMLNSNLKVSSNKVLKWIRSMLFQRLFYYLLWSMDRGAKDAIDIFYNLILMYNLTPSYNHCIRIIRWSMKRETRNITSKAIEWLWFILKSLKDQRRLEDVDLSVLRHFYDTTTDLDEKKIFQRLLILYDV